MSGAVLGMIDCPACGDKAAVHDAKAGQSSVHCKACGFQGFARSPKSSTGLRGRVAPKPPAGDPPAATPPAKGGASFADFLDGKK